MAILFIDEVSLEYAGNNDFISFTSSYIVQEVAILLIRINSLNNMGYIISKTCQLQERVDFS